MDKAVADATLARPQRAERAHRPQSGRAGARHPTPQAEIRSLTQRGAGIDLAIARRQDTRGDAFTMTVRDRQHHKRAEAGQHLKDPHAARSPTPAKTSASHSPQAAQLTEARERARQIDEQLDRMAERQAGDATVVHEPEHDADAGQERTGATRRSATREADASHEQPSGPTSATTQQTEPRKVDRASAVPQCDGGQSREPSRDPATARPKTRGPAVPPPAHPWWAGFQIVGIRVRRNSIR